MVKKNNHAPKLNKPYKPLVSVCTPTFNRRPFIPIMLECFRNQTYPKSRMEWIIVDDGTDPVKDLIDAADIPQIKYFRVEKKMALGEKRNYMHKQAKGSIIVYMDDDDYYPPERVEHAVDKLMSNKEALCAGSSEMYLYFKHIHKMYQCGPYGPNHATAGTFAFKSRLLDETSYENHAALAEEKAFLKNYTVPFVQLDPLKTILVFSHIQNTYDKKKMLDSPNTNYFKPSDKTVDMFIKTPEEAAIKKFFLEDIDDILSKYEAGDVKLKPDVLEQTKVIEAERKRMAEEMARKHAASTGAPPMGSIMVHEEGKEPVALAPEQIVEIIKTLQTENAALKSRVSQLEFQLTLAQGSGHTLSPTGAVQLTTADMVPLFGEQSKSTPEIKIDL